MSLGLFKSLLLRSGKIQMEIEREQAQRRPDDIRLLQLKKLRLLMKDKIARSVRFGLKRASLPAH